MGIGRGTGSSHGALMTRATADTPLGGDERRDLEAPRVAKRRREIDRRIIEGYLQDPRSMIEELGQAGIAKEEIIRRGAALGVTPAVLSVEEPGRSGLAARVCLRCDQAFLSLGIHNRLCRRCRGRR